MEAAGRSGEVADPTETLASMLGAAMRIRRRLESKTYAEFTERLIREAVGSLKLSIVRLVG
jgi:hypothetical protein